MNERTNELSNSSSTRIFCNYSKIYKKTVVTRTKDATCIASMRHACKGETKAVACELLAMQISDCHGERRAKRELNPRWSYGQCRSSAGARIVAPLTCLQDANAVLARRVPMIDRSHPGAPIDQNGGGGGCGCGARAGGGHITSCGCGWQAKMGTAGGPHGSTGCACEAAAARCGAGWRRTT